MSQATAPRARIQSFQMGSGFISLVLGFASFWVSRMIDGGFWHGFFQGAAIALLLVSAYLFGRSMWARDKEDREWLPSQDGPDLPTAPAGERRDGTGRG